MRSRSRALLIALGLSIPSIAGAQALPAVTGFEALEPRVAAWVAESPPAPPALASSFALVPVTVDPPTTLVGIGAPREHRRLLPQVLNAERARILLRSLTVPGWGQATLGHRTSATVFGIAEAGVWGAFTSFRIQMVLRRQSYERTARLFAGIDLRGRDEEFRRIVGSYLSSDEYNQLVVYRDAANQFYDDPVAYRNYIAQHSLTGANSWSWSSIDEILRYRAQRRDQQRASNRANTALAVAVANRLISAVHASRIAGRAAPTSTSWGIECVPSDPDDPTAFHVGVRARF